MIERRSSVKNSTNGHTGVIFLKNGCWCAEITFRGKRQYLDSFRDQFSAIRARCEAEHEIFGKYLDSCYTEADRQRSFIGTGGYAVCLRSGRIGQNIKTYTFLGEKPFIQGKGNAT